MPKKTITTRQGERQKRLREQGLCQVCAKPQAKHSNSLCDHHLERQRIRMREKLAERRAAAADGKMPAKRLTPEQRTEIAKLHGKQKTVRDICATLQLETLVVDREIAKLK